MNIVITQTCNRSCVYCFAAGNSSEDTSTEISMANVVKAVDFFVDSGRRGVSLLGGEPTLHPDFTLFVEYIQKRGLHAHVFSNGMASRTVVEALDSQTDKERLSFLVNLNHPDMRSDLESKRVDRFLSTLGPVCGIGINVFSAGLDLSYVLEAFDTYDLKPLLRIGISNPSDEGQAQYLRRQEYPAALDNIASLIHQVVDKGVEISLDCGFPLCLFTDEELGVLFRNSKPGKRVFRCNPVIDIGHDLCAWSCYPLAQYGSFSIEEFKNDKELVQHFRDVVMEQVGGRYKGMFVECEDCGHRKRRLCSGGCAAHAHKHDPVSVVPYLRGRAAPLA